MNSSQCAQNRPARFMFACAALCSATLASAVEPTSPPMKQAASGANARQFSGVYPHLASFNRQGECGTGAVVPWADRLWWISYAPHAPNGSDDKLYAADADLNFYIWPKSVGGTPANRLIHRETQQLLIGPYVIDSASRVRVIPTKVMPGRLTGNARHLTDPANKAYYATMEEGFYEVDLNTLAVKELFPDSNHSSNLGGNLLIGWHGKGLYSGQGRLIYSNNGENSAAARVRFDAPSGALAEWDGQSDWRIVRRNQFTDITGPGGITGAEHPDADPIWSIGWDHRSLILMLLDDGEWHTFRLPKASHCYDGAHGWNTEWPRIREIGEKDLLMTMHGQFWRFPATFRADQTAGLAPRSSYLKVVGDFCRWNDQVVLGCDDAAKNEFLNTRKAKGKLAGPALSQSNLWFVEPSALDQFGPALGRGAVWLNEEVKKEQPSDPFLFSGFAHRGVHLVHDSAQPVTFRFEVDRGDGQWQPLETVRVAPHGYLWKDFATDAAGAWVRVTSDTPCRATAWFEMRNDDARPATIADQSAQEKKFEGLARADQAQRVGALLRAGEPEVGLQMLTQPMDGDAKYYELKPDLSLVPVASAEKRDWMQQNTALPQGVLRIDGDSVLYVEDDGRRYRLPIGNPIYRARPELLDQQRTSREATTERDLFQAAGTFYELPARNAGGFGRIRPIATHPYFVQDYCSWRGLLALSGVDPQAADSPHLIRSADGAAAVWLGAIDDLWRLGKPVGTGGPWTAQEVAANEPSDPFLLAGYDQKSLTLEQHGGKDLNVLVEVDITGAGDWQPYTRLAVPAGQKVEHRFPPHFQAYWSRLTSDAPAKITAKFKLE